jgi:hypothetical protein
MCGEDSGVSCGVRRQDLDAGHRRSTRKQMLKEQEQLKLSSA